MTDSGSNPFAEPDFSSLHTSGAEDAVEEDYDEEDEEDEDGAEDLEDDFDEGDEDEDEEGEEELEALDQLAAEDAEAGAHLEAEEGNRVAGGTARSVLEHVARSIVDDPEGVAVEVSETEVASTWPCTWPRATWGGSSDVAAAPLRPCAPWSEPPPPATARRRRSTSSTERTMAPLPCGDESREPLLEIGRVARPHGLLGEVVVALVTNRTERLASGAELVCRLSATDPGSGGEPAGADGAGRPRLPGSLPGRIRGSAHPRGC